MSDPTLKLTYAATVKPASGLTFVIEDDQVSVTRAQPRGLVLSVLIFMTISYAALWVMFARLSLQMIDLAVKLGAPSFAWRLILQMALQFIPVLGWTIATVIGWLRYRRFGSIPLCIRVTREGLFVSKAGTFRAISNRRFLPDEVRSVDLQPVRGSLTPKPLCEIIIRRRKRFAIPTTVRAEEPTGGAPQAFVDGANRLLNLRPVDSTIA